MSYGGKLSFIYDLGVLIFTFIEQVCIKYLLYTRHCSKAWKYNSEQNG